MKRPTEFERIRHKRVALIRARRAINRSVRRAELRRQRGNYATIERVRQSHAVTVSVKAPARLGVFGDNYYNTMTFLNSVRRVALRDNQKVVLDLRKTESISPEMAPLLLAEVQRIKYIRGSDGISGISPVDKGARQTLHAMGFFDSLGMYDPYSVEKGDDLESKFRTLTGTALEGEVTKEMADQFAKALSLSADQAEAVQKAFNEALENISEHAYYDPLKIKWKAEKGRWWICAITSVQKKGAFVLACDLGMTIPATVSDTAERRGPENVAALARYIGERLALSEDERFLGAAFQDGVTRRLEGKGGRGLGKMAALVREFPHGHLSVLSGGAMATVVKGQNEVARVSKLPVKFSGTYVLWHLAQEKPE